MKGKERIRILSGALAALLCSGAFLVSGHTVKAAEAVPVAEEIAPEAVEIVPEVIDAEAAEDVFAEAPDMEAAEALPEETLDAEDIEIVATEEWTDIEGVEVIDGTDPMLADNFSYESARKISLNTEVSETTSNTSNYLWYYFEITNPGYVKLTFKHDFIDSSGSYWGFDMFDSRDMNTKFRDNWESKGNQETTTTQAIGLGKGKYYIKVDPYYDSSGRTFRLGVQYTKSDVWETEINDSFEKANKIVTNKTYHGSSRKYYDQDFYEFTLKNDGRVDIQFRHDYIDSTSTYWYLYLYSKDAKDTTYIERSYTGKIDSWVKTGGIGLKAGTYYVKVETNYYTETPYDLWVGYEQTNVWEKEFNDSFTAVKEDMKLGTSYYGSMKGSGDRDYYRFKLGRTADIAIRFTHKYVDTNSPLWKIYLYADSNKNSAKETWYLKGDDTSTTLRVSNLKPGTYYVLVENYNNYYAQDVDYSVRVNPSYGGWQKEKSTGKWWYKFYDGGYPKSKWEQIDGSWYHFDANGYMQTGWKKIGGKWYYLDVKSGAMKTGWIKVSGKWYYMNGTGVMQTGWKKLSGKWYYFGSDGVMVAGTSRKIGGKTYKFDKNGVCQNP